MVVVAHVAMVVILLVLVLVLIGLLLGLVVPAFDIDVDFGWPSLPFFLVPTFAIQVFNVLLKAVQEVRVVLLVSHLAINFFFHVLLY